MSEIMKRKTLMGSALAVAVAGGLTAALMVPVALAGEGNTDLQKGQAAQAQQMDHSQMNHGQMDHSQMNHDQMQGMDHSQMKDHGSMKHEHNADEAKAGQAHDQ
ncbi:hypothetical protein [Pseudomonas sp. BN414]|uniref:hypothetical protein n=1 Tax=Pseudomonas sp. BN414 TaxID=2567888 RepID=UPI00245691B0|nr:hypothetical protein [Pseudomonas sp. BN414]